MEDNLHQLCDALGIATSFSDAGLQRKEYSVSDKTLRFFASALGYPAATEKQAQTSLAKLKEKRWRKMLEPIYVCQQDNIIINVVSHDLSNIVITATDDKGQKTNLEYYYLHDVENFGIFYKESLRITTPLNIGYYNIEVKSGGRKDCAVLAVAPLSCRTLPDNQNLFGFAIQIYSLKSDHDWGVGDFSDLKDLIKICAEVKADVIGINPINVLYHNFPENASPYMSISRTFLNPIYIDVERVPEFNAADKKSSSAEAEKLRATETIDYTKVYNLKIKYLEKCFARFQKSKDKKRHQEYLDFCRQYNPDLDNLGLFQAIYEDELAKGVKFNQWSANYVSPDCDASAKFRKEHQERIEFFKFLQFETFRQFSSVQEQIKSSGLKIGLYRDLAVGVGRDSAEFWSNPNLFMTECGTGAPPDAFFPNGQKWGLGTFHPLKLKEQAYRPFINILRSNMQAGALRIDHVMSLMRLYVIPDKDESGTYLYYNFDDMLNLVALESSLNNCIIVGESIGNVPEGFLDRLAEKNIYSLSVLWAERWNIGAGDFKHPEAYPDNAFTSIGTHDMAPLKMWWFGYDIETNFQVGIIPDEQAKVAAYHRREDDRRRLLKVLDETQVWPEDKYRHGDYIYGEGYPEGIEEALERFMARTSSPVYLAQLEDILHVTVMQNLPGTDRDKHPNWRRKLPVAPEKLASDIAFVRCIAAIHRER